MGIIFPDSELHPRHRSTDVRQIVLRARADAAKAEIQHTPLDSPEWIERVEAALRVEQEYRFTPQRAVPMLAFAVAMLVASNVWPWGFA